jgi:hypothetical protein
LVSHPEGKNTLRVFENRILRRIFGTKRKKVTGGWRKLHKGELQHLCSSINIVRVIKSRRMRRVVHATRMGKMKMSYKSLVGNLREETTWRT